MFYTYIIRSIAHPDQPYIGHTADLRQRLENITKAMHLIHPNSNRGKLKFILLLKQKKKQLRLNLILNPALVTPSPSATFEKPLSAGFDFLRSN